MSYQNFGLHPAPLDISFFYDDVFILKEKCTFKSQDEFLHLLFDNTDAYEIDDSFKRKSSGIYQLLFAFEARADGKIFSGKVSSECLTKGCIDGKYPCLVGFLSVHELCIQMENLDEFDRFCYIFEPNEKRDFRKALTIDEECITRLGDYNIGRDLLYSIKENCFSADVIPNESLDSLKLEESTIEGVDGLAREAIMLANFLTGSGFDWMERSFYFEGDRVGYKYIIPRKTYFTNTLNLQLNGRKGFSPSTCFKNNFAKKSESYYIKNGIYSAIKNYSIIGELNEYFHIRQLAPLENLVKKNIDDCYINKFVFKNNSQKKKFVGLVKEALVDKQELRDCLDCSEEDKLNLIFQYSRMITAPTDMSFKLNDIISSFLTKKFSAKEYETKYRDRIQSACELRNDIAHSGWVTKDFSKENELSLGDLAFFVRELGQIIVLLLLDADGEFVSFMDSEVTYKISSGSLSLIEH